MSSPASYPIGRASPAAPQVSDRAGEWYEHLSTHESRVAVTHVEADPPEPDGYVCERARRALATDRRVGELGITVNVVGRRAFLSGTVATPERQDAVSAVVAEVLPGYEIHNDVSVTPLTAGPETETLA